MATCLLDTSILNVADFPAGTGLTILSPGAQPLSDPSPDL